MEHEKNWSKSNFQEILKRSLGARDYKEGRKWKEEGEQVQIERGGSPEILSFHLDLVCLDYQEFQLDQATKKE